MPLEIFLYPGATSPTDVLLRDPTIVDGLLASTGLRVGTVAPLTVLPALAAAPELLHVQASADLTATISFRADSTISVGTSAFATATSRFAADATVSIATAGAVGQAVAEFLGAPAVRVAVAASLYPGGIALGANAAVAIGSDVALRATSRLAASAEVPIGVTAGLTIYPILQAAAVVALAVASALSMEAPLAAAPALSVSGTAAALSTGAARFAGDLAFGFATDAFVSHVPAELAGTSQLRVSTQARVGAGGPSVTDAAITFNGVAAETRVRVGSISIRDERPSKTCHFEVESPPPAIGTDVKIGLSNTLPGNLLFGGTVTGRDQSFESTPDLPIWRVRCRGYGFLANRRLVRGSFTDTSATTIAQWVVNTFTSGFSTTNIASGLDAITIRFDDVTVTEALDLIARQIGGYAYIGDTRDVHLYESEAQVAPDPLDGAHPSLLTEPSLVWTLDEEPVRTRQAVRGMSASVAGSDGFAIEVGATVVPLDDASPFSSGQVIADDQQLLSFTDVAPGGVSTTVAGSGTIAPPTVPPSPQIAAGVVGPLSGAYRYTVAFATADGETTPAPGTVFITGVAVAAPSSTPGVGAGGTVGPLVGPYSYRTGFKTALGETLPSASAVTRTADAVTAGLTERTTGPSGISRLAPGSYAYRTTIVTTLGESLPGTAAVVTMIEPALPAAPVSATDAGPGHLTIGATYKYLTTIVTADGESRADVGSPRSYTPSAINTAGFFWDDAVRLDFGGLVGGPYSYALTIVTAVGESALLSAASAGSGFTTGAPGAPAWSGSFDANGRIQPGFTYFYACSLYSDVYGETPLSGFNSVPVGGAAPVRLLINLPTTLPDGADGLRLYRARSGAGEEFQLNADFRRGNIPSQYWDLQAQDECLNIWPTHPLRAGGRLRLRIRSSNETGVIARRLYRTKAGGAEYFLVLEQQHNTEVTVIDALPDAQLTVRSPVTQTTGRQAALVIATSPLAGVIARRIYRTKANGSTYYLLGELKDNTTTTFSDDALDSALTVAMPVTGSAGSQFGGLGVPRLLLPTGPAGTIARRLYRTTVNGSSYKLLAEVPDNTTTTFDDNAPDSALGTASPPVLSTAGGDQHVLTSIPIGPAGTLARTIYRTKAGGSQYILVTELADNVTTTWLDTVADTAMGTTGVPLVSTAGASAIQLSQIPTGPPTVTQRILYRTAPFGNDFKYLATINDNTTTTFLDTIEDKNLGRLPVTTSTTATIGALAGDTTLRVPSTAGFPAPGWVNGDSQAIYYTGKTTDLLTGIPPLLQVSSITRSGSIATATTVAPHGFVTGQRVNIVGAEQSAYTGSRKITVTGASSFTFLVSASAATPATAPAGHILQVSAAGAITGGLAAGTTLTTVPMLLGVSGITKPLPNGRRLAIWVVVNSAAGQALLAASEGGDGVHEGPVITDDTLESVAACTARGNAELALHEFVQVTLTYETLDTKTRSGKTVHVDLPAPTNLTGDFVIQSVVIKDVDIAARTTPRYQVTASSTRFSLEDVLRHVVLR